MTTSRRIQHQAAAFVLLEMLVVMAVVGMLAAILLPNLTRPKLPGASSPFLQFLQREREFAMDKQTNSRLVLKDRQLIASASGKIFELTDQDRLEILAKDSSPLLQERLLTTFFPDGAMTAAQAVLWNHDIRHEYRFSPFSGIRHEIVKP